MASFVAFAALSVPPLMFLFPGEVSSSYSFLTSSNAWELSFHLLGGLLGYSTLPLLLPKQKWIYSLFHFSRIPLSVP